MLAGVALEVTGARGGVKGVRRESEALLGVEGSEEAPELPVAGVVGRVLLLLILLLAAEDSLEEAHRSCQKK